MAMALDGGDGKRCIFSNLSVTVMAGHDSRNYFLCAFSHVATLGEKRAA